MTDDDADSAAQAITAAQRKRNIWPWLLLAVMTAFTLGMTGSPWLQTRVRSWFPANPATSAPDPVAKEADGIESRLAMLEQELARQKQRKPAIPPAAAIVAADADASAQVQQLAVELHGLRALMESGDAQVRDMFLLSVARRMVERGRPLAEIEQPLQDRFGGADGAAMDALRAWSREPQSIPTLAARLPGLLHAAPDAQPAGTWWERLTTALNGLVRKQEPLSAGSPERREALVSAGIAIRQGDLAEAVTMVASLPPTAAAAQWLHEARLLQGALDALDRLDGLALTRGVPAAAAVESAPPANVPAQG